MYNLRFALAPEEGNSLERLAKSLLLCENIMSILFSNKKIDMNVHFWQADDWRIPQIMLIAGDAINCSNSSEIKSTIIKGKTSDIIINIKEVKYNFFKIKGLLNVFLSAELGFYKHLDISIEFRFASSIVFRPYDDRGVDISIKNKKIYEILKKEFNENILELKVKQ